jgi:hypothetical protein
MIQIRHIIVATFALMLVGCGADTEVSVKGANGINDSETASRAEPAAPNPTESRLADVLDSVRDMSNPGAREAVKYYMEAHRDPTARTTKEDAEHEGGPGRSLLVMTWFLRGPKIGLVYTVSQEGASFNVRDVYNWAHQDSQKGQLSDKELARLRILVSKLPASTAKPPIERTVVVSFARERKWCTEIYDSASLPGTLEETMQIVEERFETKDRRK